MTAFHIHPWKYLKVLNMSHRDDYQQWPFLSQEEFELACAYIDQSYIQARLGPVRKIFKLRSRRTATTGTSYIEIVRLLHLPEEDDELSVALQNMCTNFGTTQEVVSMDMDMDTINEDEDQVSQQCSIYNPLFILKTDSRVGGSSPDLIEQ